MTGGGWCRAWVYGAIRHINKNVDYDAFFDPDNCDVLGCIHDHPNVRNYPNHADLIASAPEQQAKIDALAQALVELYRFMLRDDVQALAPDPLYRAQALSALRAIGRIP